MARLPISVRTMLLCEKVRERNGIFTLVNPLGNILIVPKDVPMARLYLYAQLTGGAGQYHLGVQIRAFGSKYILGASNTTTVEFPSERDMVVASVFRLEGFQVRKSELYEFQLVANHVEIDGGALYLSLLLGD